MTASTEPANRPATARNKGCLQMNKRKKESFSLIPVYVIREMTILKTRISNYESGTGLKYDSVRWKEKSS
jgi:hypothetical protein